MSSKIFATHIDPKKGNILVDQFSPVVVMKKVKLGPPDVAKFTSVSNLLPELTDADEPQDLESQRARREEKGSGLDEEVSFVHTVTGEELNSHVQTCLELSSENKINPKNAFALKLIDCFSFLQKRKDFSAMACTLDAGAKIYSCRVDALHHQVKKLAEEVVAKERTENKQDDDDEKPSGNRSMKEQRKWRKNNFIASRETLTRKIKANDPKDKYLRFEALPGVILSGARIDANDLSLSLERYMPFWPNRENYKPLKAEGVVSLPDIKIFRDKSLTGAAEMFPSFLEPDQNQTNKEHDDNDKPDQDKKNKERFFDGDDNATLDQNTTSIEHLFVNDDSSGVRHRENHHTEEVASIIENLGSEPNPSHDEDNHSVIGSVEGSARLDEDEVGVVLTVMDRLKEEAASVGAVNKVPTRMEALKILFDTSSEYDYLNMKNSNYWAGPEFWKRPRGRTACDDAKRKVPKKKKAPGEIVYDFKDLDERMIMLSKKTTGLSYKVIRGWKKKKTTLPPDLKVDLSWFLNLFHVENSGAVSEKPESVQSPLNLVGESDSFEEETTFHSTDPCSQDYGDKSSSQDPLNATFYEAATEQSSNSEPRDPLESTFYDAGPSNQQSGKMIRVEVSSSVTSDFGESSMVPVPKMVSVVPINIQYSTRPIRVDMRHLKHAMLEVIKEEIEKDARQKEIFHGSEDDLAVTKPEVKFRVVLKSLPSKLERRTRADLSVAIAFTALLSLANENSLQLEKCVDGDFVVRFPDSPVIVVEDMPEINSRFKLPMAK